MVEIVYVNRKGNKHRRPPQGIPACQPKPLFNGDGITPENGEPVKRLILDSEVRKRARIALSSIHPFFKNLLP